MLQHFTDDIAHPKILKKKKSITLQIKPNLLGTRMLHEQQMIVLWRLYLLLALATT